MKRLRSLFSIAAAAIALSSSASAATLSYTFFVEGDITGFLNGDAFTATSFTISATGDSSTVQSGNLGLFPVRTNLVTAPSVQINTASGPIFTTLRAVTPGYLWNAMTYTNGTTTSLYGFIAGDILGSNDGGILMVTPFFAPDLSTPATYPGVFISTDTLATTDGALLLGVEGPTPASFTVTAVPEPATATSSLLLSLGGLSLISRRNRKA